MIVHIANILVSQASTHACTAFQGVKVAASIQVYAINIPWHAGQIMSYVCMF